MGSFAIAEENLRPGSPGWDYTVADSSISGYGLPFSAGAGDTLHLFVSAQRTPVSIAIYRLGWYTGAGARMVAAHRNIPALTQPACSAPQPGPSVCSWSETDRFVIDPTWLPGVYLARFEDPLGRAAAFPFVVRSARPAAFVVVLPFATYQAYNWWGGASLYGGPGATRQESFANRAVKVSFARPLSASVFRGAVLGVDYLLVRWLEQNAYDVSYITDYDFDAGRGADTQAIGWLFSGHSEYWSWPMWLRANDARAQGMNLAFVGGNDIYWVIRWERVSVNGLEAPVVVCYRDASQDPLGGTPGLATVRFRSPPNNTPENSLTGVMSVSGQPMRGVPIDLVVADGSDPLMAGTGLITGQRLPRVAGWEGDRVVDNGATPPGIRVLFRSPYVPEGDSVATEHIEATAYVWPASGAVVYASGEPGFAWGLSTYRASDRRFLARPAIDQFMRNVLQAFAAARDRP